MAVREEIVCGNCDGVLERPLPLACPHCGARLRRGRLGGLSRRWRAWLTSALVVALTFGAVLAYLWWLNGGTW